ncbi:3-deoxy-7-phosphoheptulonate synthase [Actinomycetes bacterium KLBMP 9797]
MTQVYTGQPSGGSCVTDPLPPPHELRTAVPSGAPERVAAARRAVAEALDAPDGRLVTIVGPCSVHDAQSMMEYGTRLARLAGELADDLLVVVRAYVEKPRTCLGWPGLLSDPGLDGAGDVARGVVEARRLMGFLVDLGLPVACEWLNPTTPAYLADLVAWGCVGARTVESQPHRQLASGLPMPVGMKNGTSGNTSAAIDAVRAAAVGHAYVGLDAGGTAAVLRTTGNPYCHVVLRGGADGPNHTEPHVARTVAELRAAGLPERLMIDASHGNSGKCHERQPRVAAEIGAQIAAGRRAIRGVLLESFLVPGRQDHRPGAPLRYGQSVTDACVGWEVTVRMMRALASAVRARRAFRVRPRGASR